ncbi:MAG: FAD:protein FMN transferase [Finegoldia magna]|uniref:FAD:protein FMN transferase n=1 Tax=Finegoldia magna TaxID=1260 RepID=A0A233VL27_FINMA|nr:FAD:protein FMN transferase [Finegoldia magna]MDU5977179.1 FAD:protein FMN transferase [Finegoldia magna]MDU7385588.1 FAD:protein FMN transferase [Finegoldia magna]OXZ33126.1 thiamine biosynthesis protein [Finegoldia magna]
MKKFILVFLTLTMLVGCSQEKGENKPVPKDPAPQVNENAESSSKDFEKHEATLYDKFDTVIRYSLYTKSEKEFNEYSKFINDEFDRLHKLYSTYENFDGVDNAKTINDNAGVKPVKVDKDLFDLIKWSVEDYSKYNKKTNIAFGSVTDLWKEYRDNAIEKKKIEIPSADVLKEKNLHTSIDNIVLDEQNSTVFLKDKDSRLDLGATAKGYATEKIAQEVEKRGLKSGIISAGGNVRTIGKPIIKGKDSWVVAIQNPNLNEEPDKQYVAILKIPETTSMVTSGDYQRFYVYNNKKYHHIIDPDTLNPADHFKSVTIVTKDSGLADFLSTTVFVMNYEEGRKLVDSIDGVEAFWVLENNDIKYTDGLKDIMELEQ